MRKPIGPAAILALVGIAAAASVLASRPAAAEVLKCSAPNALSGVQQVVDALFDEASVPPAAKPVYALRFPNGRPQLTFSQFVGKAADEATRHCTARIELASPGKAAVEGPFEYDIEMTEDGKLLFTPDNSIKEQLLQLIAAYDAENGLSQEVLKVGLAGMGIDLSGKNNIPPFNSSAPPPMPGAATSNFGTPSNSRRPSSPTMAPPQ